VSTASVNQALVQAPELCG